MKTPKLFWDYLISHKKSIILWTVFTAVFWLTFSLYELPSEAVLYGAAVCFFIGTAWIVIDFTRYRRRRIMLELLLNEITLTSDNLPEPRNAEEEAYQKLIKTLSAYKQSLADEMNGRYIDMIDYYTLWAHQIKTPIAAMRLTLQSEDSARSRELSEDLQRIEQYVEMVMCYLRVGSESSDYIIKKYDLDDIVRQAVRKLSSQFIRKKIKLLYEPLNVTVLTDEKQLLFVVEQILSNAVKYTAAGSVEITLEQPKTLVIRDTGIGIAAEDISRVFEKGYTGCNGRTDKKASGLGLYLCRLICGKLGHAISLNSEAGKGTEVWIDLSETKIEVE